MDDYKFLEEYFIERIKLYDELMISALPFQGEYNTSLSKTDYLRYWINRNSSLEVKDLVEQLCQQMEILDMRKWLNKTFDNEPKLILYSGKADPYEHEYLGSIHTKVVEK